MDKPYYYAEDYHAQQSIGHLLRSTTSQVSSQLEALFQQQDVSFIQYVILMFLRDGLARTPAELCVCARYDSGALTRVLDLMQKRNFLTRTRCTQDRRVVKLHITEEGRKTLDTLIPRVISLYNNWFSHFSKDEVDTLMGLLGKFKNVVGEYAVSKKG